MTRLRIATFNLENLDDKPGLRPLLAERIAVLRPQLLRLQADILCLQEINAQPAADKGPRRLQALETLLAQTPYAGFHRAHSQAPAASGEVRGLSDVHNLVILSRFPVTETRQYWHDFVAPPLYAPSSARPGAPPAEIRWDRPILQARIDLGSRRGVLHVINVHLRSPLASFVPGQKKDAYAWKTASGWAEGFFMASIKRSGQALETRMLIDRLFDAEKDARIVVAGDFNAVASESPVRAIRAEEEDTGNGDLASRVMVAVERGIAPSQRFSVLHHGQGVMLDHLLVSRALLAWYRHAEIHNEALEDELVAFATVSRSPESYHAPVVAEFALPDETEG